MSKKDIAPYGSWKSPITSDLLVSQFVGLGSMAVDGHDVYWNEWRPTEEGRNVIVRCDANGQTQDLTPAGFDVRTRVHEYGGGEYVVIDGVIYFSNFEDQRLYRQTPNVAPEALTPADKLRYADYVFDRPRHRLIGIREDHREQGEAINTIVGLDLNHPDEGRILIEGYNFFSTPRLSPDGSQLCWLAWNHPNMPWDGTELWIAAIQPDGTLAKREQVAGGKNEFIFQPEWSPNGVLHFVSDKSGWWNLYRLQNGKVKALHPMEAEFGLPQWVFGMITYRFVSEHEIACSYTQNGLWKLAFLDTNTGQFTDLEMPYTTISDIHVGPGFLVFQAGSASIPASIVRLDLANKSMKTLRQARKITIDRAFFSFPLPITFPTTGGKSAYGIYYAPQNPDFTAPDREQPPLIVMSYGGPTAATGTVLRYGIQYWTSRGFAILDVNYGGSTGYGREYRKRLNNNWGIVDVDDCANGALYLVKQGLADPKRLAITGGSAGGYCTLAALTFKEVFKAGASHYGICDLEALARDTHKFESRYLDNLIGPYPARKDLYIERSPIHHTQRISTPLILFQGADDPIVPKNQAEMMFEAVRAKKLPVAYLLFPGEQHGFIKAENIKRETDGELYFYSKIFDFDLAEEIEPVQIENL